MAENEPPKTPYVPYNPTAVEQRWYPEWEKRGYFKGDPHSAIIDALSTMVIDGTQVKTLAWYDNEIGYVHRMMELARKVGQILR